MSDFIKERVGNRFVIRSKGYGRSLKLLLEMFFEAQRDFPFLEEKNVEVIHYGGQHYARTRGIEFDVDMSKTLNTKAIATYEVRTQVEYYM